MTTIEKIHAEFDSAQDRLLTEALSILSSVPDTTNVTISMSDRLNAVGFCSTPIAKSGQDAKKMLVNTKEQAELIRYYQYTYPFLKFLTEEELNRICAKYKLIYAPVANYAKDVPEKNLRDIEVAQKLKDGDDAYLVKKQRLNKAWRDYFDHYKKYGYSSGMIRRFVPEGLEDEVDALERKRGLFIAAPKSHFNLKGLESVGLFGWFRPEIKDPIVFRYVQGGIQVLTKWGAEGEDPALCLPINN